MPMMPHTCPTFHPPIMKVLILTLVATMLTLCGASHVPHPILPPSYSADITMTLDQTSPTSTHTWNVSYTISYPQGSSLALHGEGNRCETCVIPGHIGERCAVIVRPDFRYTYFPDSGECCTCCTSGPPQFCGVVKPDWAANGTYAGSAEIDTGLDHPLKCGEYLVQGQYVNHMFFTTALTPPDSGYVAPCEFYERGHDDSFLKKLVYNSDSFQVGPVDPSTFDLPHGVDCSAKCKGPCAGAQSPFL